MLKTKFVEGNGLAELEEKLNKALSEMDGEPKVIYFESKCAAVIEQTIVPEYEDRLCCDCAYWDDADDRYSLSNFCTLRGKRIRYNCRACKQFKDLRG